MKIYSINNHSLIEVNQFTDIENNYSSFVLSVAIDIEHGEFSAKNTDVHFFNIDEFNSNFDDFISNRELNPKLEGTYDSFIEFSAYRNRVYVHFKIGDSYCGSKIVNYSLEGSIEISQENLLIYQQQFLSLAINT